jgi:hypothetical protein
MLDFIDVKQNSDEWFQYRAGRFTSSKAGVVMANYGKDFGEPAKKYAIDIAIEQITGKPISSGYSNAHMERGHEEEPIALALYEEETFSETSNGGFFFNDFVGCSPDFVCGDGIGEIKSAIPSVHYARVKRNSFDPQYKWQCISNMYFTGSNWIDFISYCSSYPEDKQLFIHRMNRDDFTEEFGMLDARLSHFKELVNECKKNIEGKK